MGSGFGIHTVENRFVGIKSRGVYESPGMELLGKCYEFLLQLILDRRARRHFEGVAATIAEQIYEGYWFDAATQALLSSIEPLTNLASGNPYSRALQGERRFLCRRRCAPLTLLRRDRLYGSDWRL